MPTPDPSHLWQWMLSAGALLWIAKSVLDLWRTHIRTPDPVPPLHERYATRMEHKELRGEVVALSEKTDRRFAENAASSSASRKIIYESIRGLETSMAEQRTETRTQSESLSQLRRDLRDDFKGLHGRIDILTTAVARQEERTKTP